MEKRVFLGAIPFILLGFVSNGAALRKNGICSLSSVPNRCPDKEFECFNGRCIRHRWYCDGSNDCGDNSDEMYCEVEQCPEDPKFMRCSSASDLAKCVPITFIGDDIKDCPDGDDEEIGDRKNDTLAISALKARQWFYWQKRKKSTTEMGGALVDKTAVALYLGDFDFSSKDNEVRKEIAYEVSIQLLSRLWKTKLSDIPSFDLASYVNAFLVTCVNPRKFHGLDIVRELRTRVNSQTYANPYVLLALCNAGERITTSDETKLRETFWNSRRTFWTDMKAFVVMALACASKQPGSDIELETVTELTMSLKSHQYQNGTTENLQTTALIMQALFAVEPEEDPVNFDEEKALKQIIMSQKRDGSFGSLLDTYYILPILNCRSFVNISSKHCEPESRDEISAMENLMNQSGPKIRIQYSIYIGDNKDVERYLALQVPKNMSFYGIMEIASEIDSRYKFEYVVKNEKPYVNAVTGLKDNPEKEKFWFLHIVEDGKLLPSRESPADVVPTKNNEHFAMWYRSESWMTQSSKTEVSTET